MDQVDIASTPEMPASWLAMMELPDFLPAALLLAANMLRLCDEDARLSTVFKDAGHYIAAMTAAYLHGMGGLTLTLLRQICAASGFLSPGRAKAIIDVLLHLDYLEPDGDAYRPTERFLSAWRRHLQYALQAAATIDPAAEAVGDSLERPGRFAALLGIQATRLHALTQGPDPLPPLRRAFLHPYAGSQLLWTLGLAARQGPDWPSGPIKLSLSAIAARFHVSHLHVRRLLRTAQAEGLLVYEGRGGVIVTTEGARMIRIHFAAQLVELVAVAQTMREAREAAE